MAKKRWAAVQGIMKRLPQEIIDKNKLFDLNRAVKEILEDLHVPFSDDCENCPLETSPGTVRYVVESGLIQAWNGTEYITLTGF